MDVDLLWQSAIELENTPPEQPRFALIQASAPGFSFLLAGTQKLLGLSLYKHRFLMAFIGSTTVIFLMIAAWSWSRDKLTTIATGLLAALYPTSIYADTQLIKSAPELLLISILLAWMSNFRCRSLIHASLHGLAISFLLLCLIASQLSAFLLPFAITFWILALKKIAFRQRMLTITILLSLTTEGSWLVQKPELWMPDKHGAFMPISGIHATVGFHANATGNYHNIPGVPASPIGHAFVSRIVAENATRLSLTPEESNKYWQDKVLEFITENPWQTIQILLRKSHMLLSNHEVKANEYLPFIESRSALLQWLPVNWGIVLVLATIGFMRNNAQSDKPTMPILGIILCVAVVNLMTFVTWRYRLHALIPLFMLAGSGMAYLINLFCHAMKNRATPDTSKNKLSLWLLVAILVGIGAFIPLPDAVVHDMEMRAKRNNEALTRMKSIEDEIALLQEKTDTPSTVKQILLLHQLQRHTESYSKLSALITSTTDSPEANALWITYQAWLGDTEISRIFITDLLKEKPAVLSETWRKLTPHIQRRCQLLDIVPKRKSDP